MAKKKKNDPEISLSFEEALGKLEAIVQSLEEGKVGLEESLSLYEQGATLLKQGHQLLAEAEHRIEQVSGIDADGNPIVQPFPASTSIAEQRAVGRATKAANTKATARKSSREKKSSSDSGLF